MRAYQEFLQYFKNVDIITLHHLVIASHFAYGWMPKILELYEPPDGFARCTDLLNEA